MRRTSATSSGRLEALFSSRRVGIALLASSALSFAILAVLAAFAHPLLLAIDVPIRRAVTAWRGGWLDDVIRWISMLGTRYVIGALLAVLAAWVLRTGRCRVLLFVVVVAFALNPLLE